MPTHGAISTGQALYRVFVLPVLSHHTTRYTIPRASRKAYLSTESPILRRAFSITSIRNVKTRAPEARAEKWDEEITAKLIYLVDSETNKLEEFPRTRYDVLNGMNRETHRLVQFPQPDGENPAIPVCRIVDKKEAYAAKRRKQQDAKDRKRIEAVSNSLKTLELNWAIDQNDLGHRLERVREFLAEGRKVEVILASKKRGRKVSREECEEVLQKIRKTINGVDGAKETNSMQGKVGGFATLFFEGRAAQVRQAQAEEGGG